MAPDANTELVFYVNGCRVSDREPDPTWSLAKYLRDKLSLTGTKIGCNEGGCGACTVMLSHFDQQTAKIKHYSVNACLYPLCAVAGRSVTTVEGISADSQPHPIARRLAQRHGSQCGFCTPGFVMAMYALLRNHPKPSPQQVDKAIQGNLCRCTGYRPILDAFYSFCDTSTRVPPGRASQCNIEMCCRRGGAKADDKKREIMVNGNANVVSCEKDQNCSCVKNGDIAKEIPYDATQEPIFPPELTKIEAVSQRGKSFQCSVPSNGLNVIWYSPNCLDELSSLKRQMPHARLVFGNTEIGIEQRVRQAFDPVLLYVGNVPELRVFEVTSKSVVVGSGLTLNKMEEKLTDTVETLSEDRTGVLRVVIKMLREFAGEHVRNAAGFAGNLATASPISDLNQIWLAANARLRLLNCATGRTSQIAIDQSFFTGYRKTALDKLDVILSIEIPLTDQTIKVQSYKQAQRRDDDIAIVNACFWLEIDPGSAAVTNVRLAFGGVAETTKLASQTAELMMKKQRKWDESLLEDTLKSLASEMGIPFGSPGGMEKYRKSLILSFFFKFFWEVAAALGSKNVSTMPSLVYSEYEPLKSTQLFRENDADSPSYPVGTATPHASGEMHATGEAIYTDDIQVKDCLHMALVHADRARASIERIDATAASKMSGFVALITNDDVPTGGSIYSDDHPLFADKEVRHFGQSVCGVVATDAQAARYIASKVVVHYNEQKQRPIVTIEDAIAEKSYFCPPMIFQNGPETLKSVEDMPVQPASDDTVAATLRIDGQEHFYLEPHCCLVVPGEKGSLEVFASTQNATRAQRLICGALNLRQHLVVVNVKRIGGGFGGKENTDVLVTLPCAVAAFVLARLSHLRLRRPVRIALERREDMMLTGNRHPFRADASLQLDNGRLNFDIHLFSNAGHTIDLSAHVMVCALMTLGTTYDFKRLRAVGRVCKTNLASNTAFRGFGKVQAMFFTENYMELLADKLRIRHAQFREAHLCKDGDVTPYGMKREQCNLSRCWRECKKLSDFDRVLDEVEEFNRENRWRKQGVAIVPVSFGIAYEKNRYQAGALVHVYADGSVLVSHAGMEMGQGLHTKMLQVAAATLNVPLHMVHIENTSTDKVPNTFATAASLSSDLNGAAIVNACEKILKSLEPLRQQNPALGWPELCALAVNERIQLSATGFAKVDIEHYDFESGEAQQKPIYSYFVYGAGCSRVEIDCLTGDHKLMSSHLVMDVGESLNPAIDIGQIEGAFMQGVGWMTTEQLKVAPTGRNLALGPGVYKIPSAADCPRTFDVKLLGGSSNKMAIFSSKAIGEPPLFLGASVFFAIRRAILSARSESSGRDEPLQLAAPLSPERIRLACADTQVLPLLRGEGRGPPQKQWVVQL